MLGQAMVSPGFIVPPVNSVLSEIIGVVRLRPTNVQPHLGILGRARFHPPNSRRPSVGDSSTTTPDRRAATRSPKAAQAEADRPVDLDLAFSRLERLAIRADHRQAGNRDCLASQGFSIVLDLEDAAWTTWPTRGLQGRPGVDPYHEPRESALGCALVFINLRHSWG